MVQDENFFNKQNLNLLILELTYSAPAGECSPPPDSSTPFLTRCTGSFLSDILQFPE